MEEHEYTDECWETVLVCGLEETEGHTHSDDCYETVSKLVCELEEEERHEHTDECYETVLVCDISEYVHSAKCLSNNGADAEDGDDWLETLPELSGVWAEDIVAVAESQLGYMESEQNYIVDDDGERRGYTRYGAWYGNDYSAWDAMFAAFYLNYADVEDFPANSGAYAWLVELEDAGLYAEAAEHTPTGGDIIFFDSDGNGRAERAGVVNGTDDDGTVIEGDSNDAVEENDYSPTKPFWVMASCLRTRRRKPRRRLK